MVTLPMRSSLTLRRSNSPSSRWICSPSRRARGLSLAMFLIPCSRCASTLQALRAELTGSKRPRPLVLAARAGGPESQTSCDFDTGVALDLVVFLHIAVVLHADSALGSGAYFVDIVFEALQGLQSALEDDDVVAQHANRKVAPHVAVDHHATRDGAELAGAEYAANRRQPHDRLLDFGRQHAREHGL